MKYTIMATMLLLLPACVQQNPQQLAAIDDNTCRSYGFKYGTDGYGACRMNMQYRRDAQAAQDSAETQAAINKMFDRRPVATNNNPINCTSQTFGTSVHTNCQ